jgi:hypothetical protein
MNTAIYLMWYDDHPKTAIPARLAAACAAYALRFGIPATLALLSPEEAEQGHAAPAGVALRARAQLQRNTYWIGREEAA